MQILQSTQYLLLAADRQENDSDYRAGRRAQKRVRCIDPLAPKYGIRRTIGIPLRGWMRLNLPTHRGGNDEICASIGEPFERVRNARQFEGHLVGATGSLQHYHAFPAEVQRKPEHQASDEGNERHDDVVTCDGNDSAGDCDDVVREQMFLPSGVSELTIRAT